MDSNIGPAPDPYEEAQQRGRWATGNGCLPGAIVSGYVLRLDPGLDYEWTGYEWKPVSTTTPRRPARDEFPIVRVEPTVLYTIDPARWKAMCDEIDRLRRWKAEAFEVLNGWQVCYDILDGAGHPAPLGAFRSSHVAGYLKAAVNAERAV